MTLPIWFMCSILFIVWKTPVLLHFGWLPYLRLWEDLNMMTMSSRRFGGNTRFVLFNFLICRSSCLFALGFAYIHTENCKIWWECRSFTHLWSLKGHMTPAHFIYNTWCFHVLLGFAHALWYILGLWFKLQTQLNLGIYLKV